MRASVASAGSLKHARSSSRAADRVVRLVLSGPMTGTASRRSKGVTSLPNPALLIKARLATRSGRLASVCRAIAPPSELPTMCNGRVSPSASTAPSVPLAKVDNVIGPSGRSENPNPGTSTAITRYAPESRSYCGSQSSRLRPMPCTSNTGGLRGSPSTRTRTRRPSTSMKAGLLMPGPLRRSRPNGRCWRTAARRPRPGPCAAGRGRPGSSSPPSRDRWFPAAGTDRWPA